MGHLVCRVSSFEGEAVVGPHADVDGVVQCARDNGVVYQLEEGRL